MLLAVLLSVGILLLGRGSAQSLTKCPPNGWLSWNNYCYLFVNNSKVTWSQASDECQDRQGELLRIDSSDEYTFLKNALKTAQKSEMYWTALNDIQRRIRASGDIVYMWGSQDYAKDSILHWDKEPDNTQLKDCVIVNPQAKLTMARCNDHHAYVCEMPRHTGHVLHTCTSAWNFHSLDFCYKVSNATVLSERVSWAEAKKRCETITPGISRLVSISSNGVQAFLAENLPSYNRKRTLYWTGLNDVDSEGSFQWSGGDTATYQSNQFKGLWVQEPDNLGGFEYCGSLLPHGTFSDKWCGDRLNYACRISLTQTPQLSNFGCGSLWTRSGTKCVGLYTLQKTWSAARQSCKAAGGDLLKYDSKTEGEWISMLNRNIHLSDTVSGMWIGANDQKSEGVFVWADGTKAEIANWDREPDNSFNCAAMSRTGFFHSFDCSYVHSGTICEVASANCIQGWKAYGGHCYLFDQSRKTHSEASDFCKTATSLVASDTSGSLFALDSPGEKAWVLQNLPPYAAGLVDRFWCGLQNQQGKWQWENSIDDDPVMFDKLIKWSYEPNDKGNEDCVELLPNGHLNDAKCGQTRGYICQKAAPGVAPSQTGPGGSGKHGSQTRPRGEGNSVSAQLIFILIPILCCMFL